MVLKMTHSFICFINLLHISHIQEASSGKKKDKTEKFVQPLNKLQESLESPRPKNMEIKNKSSEDKVKRVTFHLNFKSLIDFFLRPLHLSVPKSMEPHLLQEPPLLMLPPHHSSRNRKNPRTREICKFFFIPSEENMLKYKSYFYYRLKPVFPDGRRVSYAQAQCFNGITKSGYLKKVI